MPKSAKQVVSDTTAKKLRRIIDTILAEPLALDMDNWAKSFIGDDAPTKRTVRVKEAGDDIWVDEAIPPCGTVCCIAGHAITQSEAGRKALKAVGGYKPVDGGLVKVNFDKVDDVFEMGRKILGITKEQAEKLFYMPHMVYDGDRCWPKQFANRYYRTKRAVTRAKIAAERIEHFIQTGE